MKRLAIIDDYEKAALSSADWSPLAGKVEIETFHDHLDDPSALAERLSGFEIVLVMRERTRFSRSLFAHLPRLEHLITSGMRNAAIDLDAAREHGVLVSGTAVLPYPAAEHAWALLLALAKRICHDDRRGRAGGWSDEVNVGLQEKTLGVIGLGKLGARVARIGLAFGMNVVAWSPNLTPARCGEIGVDCVSKDELLRGSDFVTIHLVLGERSRGLIGRRELAMMKPTAFLVNTSRGPIIDEEALLEALAADAIAGAGLDVFDREPLPEEHPLRRLGNTVLTPHKGYVTRENYRIFYEGAVANIRAWLDHRPINVLSEG